MEVVLTIVIVVVAVLWACWSSYRTLTGKKDRCNCTGTCGKNLYCRDQ